MATITLPATGGCRCDRVRFVIEAAPLLASACHCRGCQRMTGSAYSLTLGVPTDGFRVTAGEPVIGGCHGPDFNHWHCDWCKSWVYTAPATDMGFVNVRATMLDDPYWFSPFVEVETAEKLAFAETHAPHSFDRMPDMAGWGELIEAYRAAQ